MVRHAAGAPSNQDAIVCASLATPIRMTDATTGAHNSVRGTGQLGTQPFVVAL